MQVPASATTAGAESAAAGTSSSLFGALAGASSAKKGQLPPFAAILSEQSFDTDAGKDIGDLVSAAGDGGANEPPGAASSLTAQAGPKALFNPLPVEVANSDGGQNKTQSLASASSKNEIKPMRHRTLSDSLSGASGKKQSPAVPELAPSSAAVVSAYLITAQAMPAIASAKASHSILDASLPSATAPLPQHSSIAQSQSENLAVTVNSDSAKPEVTPTLAADSITHDLQSQVISSAKTQFTQSPLVAEAAAAIVSIPDSVAARRQVSSAVDIVPVSGTPDGLNNALAPFAGPVVRGANSQATVAPLSKSKTQEKTNSDIVRGLSASVAASGASSTDTTPSHSVALMVPSARGADAADSSPKQGPSVPDANAFQRLDSGGTPATLLHSSAHQIAVGVHDPSLGWLEVQTQSSAGHISATLTAASTEAHASLAAQAPAITQYLADRNVSVHSVNVHTQADAQGGASSGGGQPQSDTENARHEVSEHGGVGMEESRSSSFSQTGNEPMPQTRSSSYISIHA
ncbi:MAG TPA: flagellar hook-length control protein FliK [Alloacidobacterium sp.]|nr:flagellar hook-length control protein FliK [Alloacidobacterium sp.]